LGHKVLPFLGKDAPAPLGSEQGGRLAAIFHRGAMRLMGRILAI